MEIYQLKSFVAVAKTGNLTRAARESHQSPSAVSTQIKALEAELGLSLFDRTPRGMVMTPKGQALLGPARQVLVTAEDLMTQATALRHTLSGNLNLGINTDPAFLGLSRISRAAAAAMPGISLTFVETQTFSTPEQLEKRQIDLGFHFGTFDTPSIFSQPLFHTRIRVVLPARMGQHVSASLAELTELPWIWTRHQCPFHLVFQRRLDQAGLSLEAVTEAVDENIVEELVKSGTGLALMREAQAQRLVDQGLARFWDDPGTTLPLGIACLESRKSEPAIALFLDTVTALPFCQDSLQN